MPPFDDINVRKAVIANANRTDLRNTRGGELTGPVATTTSRPSFRASSRPAASRAPDLDYLANPTGTPSSRPST